MMCIKLGSTGTFVQSIKHVFLKNGTVWSTPLHALSTECKKAELGLLLLLLAVCIGIVSWPNGPVQLLKVYLLCYVVFLQSSKQKTRSGLHLSTKA